jgi:hypothetical protein
MIIQSEMQLYIECTPKDQIEKMEEFIHQFNGLIKVQLEEFVGHSEEVNHVSVGIRTSVQSQEVSK